MAGDGRLTGWAVVLGASSGFGEACTLELAARGMDILGIHLDRAATQPNADRIQAEVKRLGRKALFINMNAADEAKRKEALDQAAPQIGEGGVKLLLHSLAFGTLKPYIGDKPADALAKSQMEMTLDVMAHSLVYWVQDLFHRKLLGKGARIYAMTSEGGARIWKTYGAVSAAKAALESHIRQLAVELAPHGITANAIRAGVTDTPALRKIPGNEQMIEASKRRNPGGRLTEPKDVARAIGCLATSDTQWITGNIIGVDGGEFVTS